MEDKRSSFHYEILKDLEKFFETTKTNFIHNRNRVANEKVIEAENNIKMIARWLQGSLIEMPWWFDKEVLKILRGYGEVKFLFDQQVVEEIRLAIRNIEAEIDIREQKEGIERRVLG